MKASRGFLLFLALVAVSLTAPAVESGRFRLLSVSQSNKMILVSKIPDKIRYILDASTAKITVNDKAAELEELMNFSVITLQYELKKSNKNGIEIDGVATEIKVSQAKEEIPPAPVKPPP